VDLLKELLPTLLVVSTGLLTWFLKDKSENLKLQREKLVEEKRNNYKKLLEPIIRIFGGIKNPRDMSKAMKQIQSHEYRTTAFELVQFGSDNVVNAYNNFFQYLYKHNDDLNPKVTLQNLGAIILEIRKDVGHSKTELQSQDMLKFMIKDIDSIYDESLGSEEA